MRDSAAPPQTQAGEVLVADPRGVHRLRRRPWRRAGVVALDDVLVDRLGLEAPHEVDEPAARVLEAPGLVGVVDVVLADPAVDPTQDVDGVGRSAPAPEQVQLEVDVAGSVSSMSTSYTVIDRSSVSRTSSQLWAAAGDAMHGGCRTKFTRWRNLQPAMSCPGVACQQ
jgi:hypothetical protein